MELISGDRILATFKIYQDIKACVFDDRTERACIRFGARDNEKIVSFREGKEFVCSCIRFSEFKKLLRFYYKCNLNEVANNEKIFFECCNQMIVEYTNLNDKHYLIKPDKKHSQNYSHLKTYVKPNLNTDDCGEICQIFYIHIACIMLYSGYYDSLTFFSDFVENQYERDETSKDFKDKVKQFIQDFRNALQTYYIYLYNNEMLSNDFSHDFASEFFTRVSKHKNKHADFGLYSCDFEF